MFASRITISTLLLCLALLSCASSSDKPERIRLDYATYNPLSLLLRDQHLLEDALAPQGVQVEWVKSLGSNKALELLNSKSIDFGSTAGSAALIARANKNPIRAIYVYSKPEWTALVTSADSGIQSISDLRGKKIAATRGTDAFVFLLRALDSVGLSERDVEIVPLQHPDGKLALERGDVQAWAGLDPMMASAELESQARIFYRNPDWNTYGVLDVRQEFAQRYPAYVERVLEAYERSRSRPGAPRRAGRRARPGGAPQRTGHAPHAGAHRSQLTPARRGTTGQHPGRRRRVAQERRDRRRQRHFEHQP